MKNNAMCRRWFLVAATVAVGCQNAFPQAKKNAKRFEGPVFESIRNGSFEKGLEEWTVEEAGLFSISDDMPAGRAGKSLRYRKSDGEKGRIGGFSQVVDFADDAYYRLRFSYKGDGVRQPVLLVEEHFGEGACRRLVRLKPSGQWEDFDLEFTMGNKGGPYRLHFFPAGFPFRKGVKGPAQNTAEAADTGDGTVCFTGFALEKTGRVDTPMPDGPYAFKTETITYKKTDTVELVLMVDMPQGIDGPFPVMVLVHGGGWVTGSPQDMLWRAKLLAERGVACVRVQYRLVKDGGTFEKSIGDIMDAVEWVRQNAGTYRFDLARFGFSGGSAGGHLSSIAAQRTPECNVYAGFCGLYDAVDRGLGRFGDGANFIGTDIESKKKASAIYQIKTPPPATILFHGEADPTVDYIGALRFADALRAKGGRAETMINPGCGHEVGPADPINRRLIDFLNREWGLGMEY